MSLEPIAYVDEAASVLCEDCAVARYGSINTNDMSACFSWCETDSPHVCGSCHAFLGGSLTEEGQKYTVENFWDNDEVRAYYAYLAWPQKLEDLCDDCIVLGPHEGGWLYFCDRWKTYLRVIALDGPTRQYESVSWAHGNPPKWYQKARELHIA